MSKEGKKGVQMTPEQMEGRIARFNELAPIRRGYLDTAIPGHKRTIYNVIGQGVTEDPTYAAAIPAEDFNITYVTADAQNGAALHSHTTVEVFIPITGRWAFIWGDDGEHQVELGPRDVISVPAGVMRAFRNVSEDGAFMIAIQGGTDSGRVTWPESVINKAREYGSYHDEHGNLDVASQGSN